MYATLFFGPNFQRTPVSLGLSLWCRQFEVVIFRFSSQITGRFSRAFQHGNFGVRCRVQLPGVFAFRSFLRRKVRPFLLKGGFFGEIFDLVFRRPVLGLAGIGKRTDEQDGNKSGRERGQPTFRGETKSEPAQVLGFIPASHGRIMRY